MAKQKKIDLVIKVWRQENSRVKGRLARYELRDISVDMSFLEMLDVLNEQLIKNGEEPVAFDHDCREGICGMCGAVVNGRAHGPEAGTTLCQLHMRHFKSGDTLVIEPFRARAFPLVRDLVVDRSAFDSLIQQGGYISVNCGGAPDANGIAVSQEQSEAAMDAAACIGCGACVAACPNAAAMLFISGKVSHLALLPQGKLERKERALAMIRQADALGFGACTNERECEAVCPKRLSISNIARLNREFLAGLV